MLAVAVAASWEKILVAVIRIVSNLLLCCCCKTTKKPGPGGTRRQSMVAWHEDEFLDE